MGGGTGRSGGSGARLPGDAPQDLKDFVACTRDEVEVDTERLDWIDKPDGSPDTPIEIVAGDTPNTGTIKIGWGYLSLELPVSIVDGQLTIDVPGYYPDEIENGIDNWVRRLNETLRANGKQFDSFQVRGKKVTMRKGAVASAPAAPPPVAQPPTPAGEPAPPPTEGSSNKGCFAGILAALAAIAVAVGLTLSLTGGDDGDDETATDEVPAEETPADTPTPTPTPVPPTPTPPDVGALPDEPTDTGPDGPMLCGDFQNVAPGPVPGDAAGVPVWNVPALHASCTLVPDDNYAGCDPVFLPCSSGPAPPLISVSEEVDVKHRGEGPPDSETGETGPSDAGFWLWVLGYGPFPGGSSVGVASDCGGQRLTGESPLNPDGPTEVRHPLRQFGGCEVVDVFFDGVDQPVVVPPSAFGDGGLYTIDAPEIDAVPPDISTLALTSDRFRVEADWADAARVTHNLIGGSAPVDDSGCFFFFDPDNTEVLVKVLDACAADQNRFWVFYGATTDVEFEVTVSDHPIAVGAGSVNSQGDPFASVGDTSAFAGPLFDNTIFPCGPGMAAFTVCPDGRPDVPVGGLVAVSVAFAGPIPLTPDGTARAHDVDFTASGGPLYRMEQAEGGWILSSSSGSTAARAIIRDNALTLAVPRGELPQGALVYQVRTEVEGQILEQSLVPVDGLITAPSVGGDAAPTTDGEDLAAFYGQLSTSISSGDLAFAEARLHPTVFEAYPDQCPAALASFVDPDFSIELIAEGEVGPWTWELPDGRAFDVPEATTVTIALSGRGQSGEATESHVAIVDGEYRWFTFCG